jgi:hypothetical protein
MSAHTFRTLICVTAISALLLGFSDVQSQEPVDNTDAYALANQLADELELVRERMGRPFDDSPRLPVTGITQTELYFQVQTLLRKSNQLAQELAGVAPRAPGPVPSGEITPADVYELLDDALAQIRHVADAIGITERVEYENRLSSISPTGIFLVVIDINRQLNLMLRVPISDADVFDEISTAITYATSLLAYRTGSIDVPQAPAFDGYKRPADVYLRLTECIDAIIRVAPNFGVPVLGLASRRNIPDDTEPGQVLDIARLVTADLAAFTNAIGAPLVRPELPTPRHSFSTEVYAHAGILLEQIEALDRQP